jgi:hypothetical protein
MWWPALQEKVNKITKKYADQPTEKGSERTDRELIEEILQLTRLELKTSRRTRAEKQPDFTGLTYAMRKIMDFSNSALLPNSTSSNPAFLSPSSVLALLTDIGAAINFTAEQLDVTSIERAGFHEWLEVQSSRVRA